MAQVEARTPVGYAQDVDLSYVKAELIAYACATVFLTSCAATPMFLLVNNDLGWARTNANFVTFFFTTLSLISIVRPILAYFIDTSLLRLRPHTLGDDDEAVTMTMAWSSLNSILQTLVQNALECSSSRTRENEGTEVAEKSCLTSNRTALLEPDTETDARVESSTSSFEAVLFSVMRRQYRHHRIHESVRSRLRATRWLFTFGTLIMFLGFVILSRTVSCASQHDSKSLSNSETGVLQTHDKGSHPREKELSTSSDGLRNSTEPSGMANPPSTEHFSFLREKGFTRQPKNMTTSNEKSLDDARSISVLRVLVASNVEQTRNQSYCDSYAEIARLLIAGLMTTLGAIFCSLLSDALSVLVTKTEQEKMEYDRCCDSLSEHCSALNICRGSLLCSLGKIRWIYGGSCFRRLSPNHFHWLFLRRNELGKFENNQSRLYTEVAEEAEVRDTTMDGNTYFIADYSMGIEAKNWRLSFAQKCLSFVSRWRSRIGGTLLRCYCLALEKLGVWRHTNFQVAVRYAENCGVVAGCVVSAAMLTGFAAFVCFRVVSLFCLLVAFFTASLSLLMVRKEVGGGLTLQALLNCMAGLSGTEGQDQRRDTDYHPNSLPSPIVLPISRNIRSSWDECDARSGTLWKRVEKQSESFIYAAPDYPLRPGINTVSEESIWLTEGFSGRENGCHSTEEIASERIVTVHLPKDAEVVEENDYGIDDKILMLFFILFSIAPSSDTIYSSYTYAALNLPPWVLSMLGLLFPVGSSLGLWAYHKMFDPPDDSVLSNDRQSVLSLDEQELCNFRVEPENHKPPGNRNIIESPLKEQPQNHMPNLRLALYLSTLLAFCGSLLKSAIVYFTRSVTALSASSTSGDYQPSKPPLPLTALNSVMVSSEVLFIGAVSSFAILPMIMFLVKSSKVSKVSCYMGGFLTLQDVTRIICGYLSVWVCVFAGVRGESNKWANLPEVILLMGALKLVPISLIYRPQ